MFPFRSRVTTLGIRLADKLIFMLMGILSFIVCYFNIGLAGFTSNNSALAVPTWASLIVFVISFVTFIYSLINYIVFIKVGRDSDSPSNVVVSAHDKFYVILLIVEVVLFVSLLFKNVTSPDKSLSLIIYMGIPVLIVTFISSLFFRTIRLIYKYSRS